MARPQQPKRKRMPLREKMAALEPRYGYCPECHQPIHNRGAHAEACPGPGKRTRCEARVPGYGHGVYTYCVRPWGHEGGHIYQ